MDIKNWQEFFVLYRPPFPATFAGCVACQLSWGNSLIVYTVLYGSWIAMAWGLILMFRKMNAIERKEYENV